jgi:hypothetical protein
MTDIAVSSIAPTPVKRAILCLWLSWLVGFVRTPVQLYNPELQEKLQASIPLILSQEGMGALDPSSFSSRSVLRYLSYEK